MGSGSQPPEIADSANRCLDTLQKCLLRASSIHPRELAQIEDQIARLRTWSASFGVFAPGRNAADYRLRYAPDVQAVIVGLLQSLHYRAQTCSDILDPVGNYTASAYSSELPSSDETLARALQDVVTELSHLNRSLDVVRRASIEARDDRREEFEKPVSWAPESDEPYNSDNPEHLASDRFFTHIRDRFPSISETIVKRLIRTMLLRRRRVLYRRYHALSGPVNTSSIAELTETKPQTILKGAEHSSLSNLSSGPVPFRVKIADISLQEMLNTAASSPFMVLPNQKVPSDRHETFEYPLAPRFGTKHEYERLKEQRLAAYQAGPTDAAVNLDGDSTVSSNTPQPNLGEGMEGDLQTLGEVTCPYCLDALPTGQVIEERRWRDHILSDLDPYICLFEGCTHPDVLYTSSDAWVNHLRQHNQYWRCLSHRHSGTFKAREDYIQHLRIQHKMNLHDTKLRALASRNVRYAADLFSSCPLCSDDTTTGDRLLEHITGHLRSLALISLPITHEGVPGEVAGKKAGFDTSQPLGGATVEDLSEDKAATLSDAERLEHNKLNSNASLNTDDVKARSPKQGAGNDFLLQSLLQHQKDVPSSSVQQSECDFTLERFLKDVPKLYWMARDGTVGPAVGLNYEPMPEASYLGMISDWPSHYHTMETQLVTIDDQVVGVAAKIMRAANVEALRNRFDTFKSLRHKHISAVLGNFCLLNKEDKLEYGFLEFPLAGLVLDDLLEEISGYNRYHEQQSLSWSPHHSTRKLLPYFACLCKTLMYLREQPRPIKHREIKPSKILIDQADNVILTGFDMSQALDRIQDIIIYRTSDGRVVYSPYDIWQYFADNDLEDGLKGLEWDVISLGFVFLEMATVSFGKTLAEMRANMTYSFGIGTNLVNVSYSKALVTGKVDQWLDVLEKTATSTPWKTPQQFAHMTKGRPDYVKGFLDAIRGMLFVNRNDRDPLKHAWMVFGCLSTHCPSP